MPAGFALTLRTVWTECLSYLWNCRMLPLMEGADVTVADLQVCGVEADG